eukprot:CAMPEP_0201991450 /NCGR_PEP_ID=MMETSP0905-20130828/274_1 /ASSEMBLY_ACC=CAM_ASM_000554 /TAXON_ID=420261 /ORGANISM="Thalassiosira antarctica, Strain CCMP982" /LENGTH=216 /DNA_ID=CAMNT_0048545865 /DNA_START=59 /DNA_END=706 /DNA_ORIENTATION=-
MKLFFAASTLLLAVRGADLNCPSELTQLTTLHEDPALNLYTAVVLSPTSDSESILCARLEYDSEAWVGFGISPTGMMYGANFVLANAGYDSVQKYNSTFDETKQKPVVAMDETHQTLMNNKVTYEDGVTVVEFTKLLKEEGEHEILADGDNTFLWAVGSSNAVGYHAARAQFTLDFKTTAPAPTSPTPDAPIPAAPTPAAPTPDAPTPAAPTPDIA